MKTILLQGVVTEIERNVLLMTHLDGIPALRRLSWSQQAGCTDGFREKRVCGGSLVPHLSTWVSENTTLKWGRVEKGVEGELRIGVLICEG